MITPAFNLTATERVLPKLALDFTTAFLDSRVTFTRLGNTATVVNSSGLVATINANLPRFDYDPVTLTCKGLLIEESRSNLLLYSSDFTNAYWTKDGTFSATAGSELSPDGVNNANKLTCSAANNRLYRNSVTTTAVATTYSVYIKAGTASWIALRLSDSTNTYRNAWFNVSTGTVGTVNTNLTASIENAGNGWWRCKVTVSTAYAGGSLVYIYLTDADGSTGNAGDTKFVHAWGAQLEAGAFATSYIPTEATALTRNADVATMTGTNFSDWFNASEGTFSATLQSLLNSAASGGRAFCVNDNTAASSYILVWVTSASQMRSRLFTGGATQYQFSFTNDPLAENTITTAYKVNNFAGANNGSTVSTDASGTLASPAPTQLVLTGDGTGTTEQYKGHLKQLLYWPQRLTNAEVEAFSKG